jgi:hypothetical protein
MSAPEPAYELQPIAEGRRERRPSGSFSSIYALGAADHEAQDQEPLTPSSKAWGRGDVRPRAASLARGRQSKFMRRLRIGVLSVILISSLVLYMTVDVTAMTEDYLSWVKKHTLVGVLTFILAFLLFCVLMIPGTPLMLGAGFALGVFWGQIAVSLGATIGAQMAFYIGQRLLRSFVEEVPSVVGAVRSDPLSPNPLLRIAGHFAPLPRL